jgi:hypothetical protein
MADVSEQPHSLHGTWLSMILSAGPCLAAHGMHAVRCICVGLISLSSSAVAPHVHGTPDAAGRQPASTTGCQNTSKFWQAGHLNCTVCCCLLCMHAQVPLPCRLATEVMGATGATDTPHLLLLAWALALTRLRPLTQLRPPHHGAYARISQGTYGFPTLMEET